MISLLINTFCFKVWRNLNYQGCLTLDWEKFPASYTNGLPSEVRNIVKNTVEKPKETTKQSSSETKGSIT